MRVSVVQTHPVFGRKQANLARALEQMESVQARLYVLPELFATGYLFEDRRELQDLAEPVTGSQISSLCRFSKARDCAVVAGFAEREGERVYNASVLIEQGELRAVYRKLHLFAAETELFDRADGRFQVIQAAGARLGLMICFDWVFPEAARCLALAGAQLLCHPSNLVLPYCQKAMVTRSIENRVYTLLANRVGREQRAAQDLTFTGGSEIVSPAGEVLAQADTQGEDVLYVEIDPLLADNKWITKWNHVHRDRRPDCYPELCHTGRQEA